MEPVTVWWASLADAPLAPGALLDPVERARRERYLHAEDRERFTLGVVMTRTALAPLLGVAPERVPLDRSCADCGKPHGAPRVEGGPRVSVSHSGDRVAVAVSVHGPVGVDVEAASGRLTADIGSHLLAAGEAAADEAALLAYWTRKEALTKATGEGLREPFTRLRVSGPDEPPALLAWDGRPGLADRFAMRALDPGPGHVACLAMLDHPAGVEVAERAYAPLPR
ncbi:4'-phosphopantetheinyl transferase family protein [Actinomadura parmotrematis]|uniref:4'-phosphopantetheinyl transferase superfamily protein n=1 Tax=Actinomadura parmotrematis TaxID=2864039 RepID=A0ABS7G1V9_9ACTN|nr:4'-phosphopantetheinyl transferase superfamily protein [Actinomadura parmotrematis]MBW8486689.1 4'-phosphopantetheinyl transferase superfamily protein [Actinomadura parmotrematis]